jgi:hypothetical protein
MVLFLSLRRCLRKKFDGMDGEKLTEKFVGFWGEFAVDS